MFILPESYLQKPWQEVWIQNGRDGKKAFPESLPFSDMNPIKLEGIGIGEDVPWDRSYKIQELGS